MKRIVRKALALLLTFVLVGAAWILPVFPVSAETGNDKQNTGEQKPEVIEKTTDSIKLRAEENYEYAIETGKENVKVWSWAQEGQYDRKNGVVIFSGLQAGEEYRFACRMVGEKMILSQNSAIIDNVPDTTVKAEETQTPPDPMAIPPEKTQNQLEGAAGLDNSNENNINSNSDLTDKSQGQTDGIPSAASNLQYSDVLPTAKPTLTAPEPPVIVEIKDTEIVLGLPENAESKYNYEYSSNGIDFQAGSIFGNLMPDTEYQFFVRIAKGDYDGITYPDSDKSTPAVGRTKKSAPEKLQFPPELVSRTNTNISLRTSENEKDPSTVEFGKLISDTDAEWNTTGLFDNLNPGTEYQFAVRRAVDNRVQMQGEASDILCVTTLQEAAQAPSAPELLKRSDSMIILKAADNQQYAQVLEEGTLNWQDSAEFNGLAADTEYQFITRTKFDPETALESIPSEAAKFKTAISFQGAKISGIENGGSYEAERTWTATAVGVGMDKASLAVGDTRWAPKTWTWDGATVKSWDKAPYTVKFKCTELGNYKLTVGFQLEEYTDEGWKATEYINYISTSFTIIEKKVTIFTITAEAGENGKISPDGSVDVEKGKDCEFTFTPDKGYRVAKVLVDGQEVKTADNRYFFKDVQVSHKISVTFEKDKRTPKTGDNTQFVIVLGIFLISGMAVVMLAYRKRKR